MLLSLLSGWPLLLSLLLLLQLFLARCALSGAAGAAAEGNQVLNFKGMNSGGLKVGSRSARLM
jgi:hypothetical protein